MSVIPWHVKTLKRLDAICVYCMSLKRVVGRRRCDGWLCVCAAEQLFALTSAIHEHTRLVPCRVCAAVQVYRSVQV